MKDVKTVAAYICARYEAAHGERIDEMKLHKLLYFAQRENLIEKDEPLFAGDFEGWRFGPVLTGIREIYSADAFEKTVPDLGEDQAVVDAVLAEYADKDAWSLSRLTHGEISWKRSRKGIPPSEKGSKLIPLDDIRDDADRLRKRRQTLGQYGLL